MSKKNIIVELAGRDSIVSLLRFMEEAESTGEKYNFIFSIAYVPCEYDPDPKNNIFALGEILKLHVQRLGHVVKELIYSAETGVWFDAIKPVFGEVNLISSPCIACHAYCHLCRLDLALHYDADIITGERLIHWNPDGVYTPFCPETRKINQYREVIDFMDEYFRKKGISFIRPLLNISNNDIVKNMYKEKFLDLYDISENDYPFPKCILSGNIKITEENEGDVKEYISSTLKGLESHMDFIIEKYRGELEKTEPYSETE